MTNPLNTTRWSIRRKLNMAAVLPALVVTVVLVCIHFVATDRTASRLESAGRSLQDRLHDQAVSTVEQQGTWAVRVRAEGVAGQVEVYLRSHPDRAMEELTADARFRELAIQSVGEGGYTCLAISRPPRLWVHKHATFEGMTMAEMAKDFPELSETFRNAFEGQPGAVRYDWQDPDGTTRRKYLHLLPIDAPGPGGRKVVLAATIYADEFHRPVERIDRAVAIHRGAMQETVGRIRAWSGWLAVVCGLMTAILAYWVAVGATRHLSERVDGLVGVAEGLAAGEQPSGSAGENTDELGRLERSLYEMAGVLGERDRLQQAMNRELERRVKERTDQLQGANERLAGALHAKQAAAEQLENQLRFASALLDTIPSPLFYKDARGVYRDCNRAFAREILGVEREDVIGKTLFELSGSIPADLARLYHQKDMELLSTGGKQSYEATVRVCGGGDRHFLFHKAVFTDAEGQAVGLIGVMLDIHDRKEAEQSIRDHRERLRVVLESILDGVVTTGANGAIRSLNPAAERLLGMPAADAEGRAASEILSIRDNNSDLQIENPTEWALNTTQADREMLADLVLTGADGVDRPISLTASLIGEEGVVLTFRDETELRAHRREKQRLLVDLRERVKELNCLVQLSQVVEEPGISFDDLMEQAVVILPAAYRFSEQAGAEIVLDDQTYATRPCPPQAPTQSANLQVCGQTVGWVRVFYSGRLPATDGEDIFLPSERVMLDAFSERLGRIAERKRYERELAEVRAAVDGAADGILLLGSDGKPRYSNHAFRELFHCMTEELGCEAPQCLFARESDAEEVAAVIEQEDSWRKELPLQTCTGKGFTGHLRITPVLNRDHRIGTLIAVADVTRQRHLEEQVRNAQKLSAVGQLAAGIAHEINTPTQFVGDNLRFLQEDLSAVLARLVQLRKEIGPDDDDRQRPAGGEAEELSLVRRTLEEMDLDYLEEEVPDALSQSLEGVERIASIVGAMKDFSHSSGPTEWSQVDLARMVRSTVTIARNEWKYCAKLELDLPEDIPPVPCLADDISQVLLNLLTNAAQAIREKTGDEGDKGCITIAAGVQEDQVEIRVTDTGGGIPEDIRPRVFEPFFTNKEVGDGTGQGLSIAYATVVEGHGGSIGFTTEVGEGTTFIVQLPLRQDGQADEAIAAGNVGESGDE